MSSTTFWMRASVFETSGDFLRVQLRMTALSGVSSLAGMGAPIVSVGVTLGNVPTGIASCPVVVR